MEFSKMVKSVTMLTQVVAPTVKLMRIIPAKSVHLAYLSAIYVEIILLNIKNNVIMVIKKVALTAKSIPDIIALPKQIAHLYVLFLFVETVLESPYNNAITLIRKDASAA